MPPQDDRTGELPTRDPPVGATFVESVCEWACTGALLGMIALIGSEAIARNVFNTSLQISDEIGGYLLVVVSFLGLSVAQAHGSFHQVELVQARLSPHARLISQLFFDLLALLACIVLTWQLARMNLNSWRSGDTAPTILLTPLWLPQLSMPIGMALLSLTVLRTLIVRFRRLRLLPPTPPKERAS